MIQTRARHSFAWFAACVLSAGPAGAQSTASLHNADVIMRFAADAVAPHLLTLEPTRQAAWRNRAPESLIEFAERGGERVSLRWRLDRQAGVTEARHVAFVYTCASPRLRLTWEWTARAAFGPVEHQVRIENLDTTELWLPMPESWRFDWHVEPESSLRQLYIEKGSGKPSADGTHDVAVRDGYAWTGTSSTYAHDREGAAREIIPWFLVQREDQARSGWYVGIEFSGRTRLSLRRGQDSLHGEAGLNPDLGPVRTRVAPGKSVSTPVIFVGAFSGSSESAGNSLRRWVRGGLTNPLTWKKPSYPLLTNNSWGSGMAIDEDLAHRMIRDSAELGLEMFHIDAGWFRGVGNWRPNPTTFPHGLAAIADDAHRHGLKFGLWVDWTQAGMDTEPGALNARDSHVQDWLVTDVPADWKPEEYKGQTIDIGHPPAARWAEDEVTRIVKDYGLDMLEHDGYLVAQGCTRTDHPHAPPDPAHLLARPELGPSWVESSNSTDVSYHAVRSYYEIHSALRKQYPDLLLEVCNDGGRMVDFGSAAHADYFSITDTYDPVSNRRAFYDTSHVLPPAMLESYIEKWPTPRIENFRYMLRSGMMGWATVMQDTTAWTAEQHDAAKREFQLYKEQLRPFIRTADLYHVSERPDGVRWDGIEYFDPHTRRGVVFVFRGSAENEPRHTLRLTGLRPEARYALRFQDRSAPDTRVSGRELLEAGVPVHLPVPNSSELVFVEEVGAR